MKRYAPVVLLMSFLLAVVAPFALAAATQAPPATPAEARKDGSPAAPIAAAISTVTGIAISPLLGTSGYGAYQWFKAKDEASRAALPWFAQVKFWLPAMLLVGVCALKDSFGAIVPTGLKKPLDMLETVENKFSGLVAAGAVVPFAMDTLSGMLFSSAVAPTLVPTGVAAIHLAAFDLSWLLNLLTVPFGIAVYVLVWLASHAINVLIILSPWGMIDAGLKAARTALLGLITISATMNPWISAILSLVVVVFAYFIAGWAFRLTIFGAVFCWEFVTRRRNRFKPSENNNRMFAGAGFRAVPIRTYGNLVKKPDGGFDFNYRPWLFLAPRTAAVPEPAASLAAGTGAIFSDIVDAEDRTLFTLPPRYHGHEEALARFYGMAGIRPIGLHKAWSELRDMLGGRAVKDDGQAA